MRGARETLREHISTKAIVHGKVTLSSGREADYYVDLRRVTLDADAAPLVGQVMAADRSLVEVEAELVAAYTPILRRPEVEVVLRQAGPLKVWVDGEVRTPGVYDMPGDIDPGCLLDPLQSRRGIDFQYQRTTF